MNNRRPLSKRKTVQMLVILTILAWATQTLMHQWGYGQEVPQSAAGAEPLTVSPDMIEGQKFVPADRSAAVGGALELRAEATVTGNDVKLKQVCRWSDADAPLFASIADLTIAHLAEGTAFRVLSVDDIRQTLQDAGTNLAMINFVGQTRCTVTRSDAAVGAHDAIDDWIAAHDRSAPRPAIAAFPVTQPSAQPTAILASSKDAQPDSPFHSLRDLLTTDLCQRLGVAADQIQMTFSPQDQKVLGLCAPLFKFDIQPRRAFNLGMVSWDVTVYSDSATKKITIIATARAWEDQVIVARPLAYKQLLRAEDFTTRRVLSEALPGQTLLRLDQCVGQQASGDFKPGAVMTARMVDPVPLVHAGQLVTVTLTQGSVQIRSVGRAMEQGSLGQSIKVRNETTRDVFDVTVTGPQEGRLGGDTAGGSPAAGT
jgi:flagella basal body P-ring formation protein FlgA